MTLNQILLDASAVLDLSPDLPSGDELTLRENYANQAVNDAAGVSQFPEFKTEYSTLVTTSIIPLPSNFRELMLDPKALGSGGWVDYPEIDLEDKYTASGNYCYITGDPQSGYTATFHGLTDGMSLSIIYQKYPVGMQSLSAICELSDPTYVTRKVESYVLYSRGDDRFQTAESRANSVLLNMTGRKMKGPGGQPKSTRSGFTNPLG